MAKLMTDTITGAGVAPETSKTPEKNGGMFEGLRKRKEAKRVLSLVTSAISQPNGQSAASLKEATEIFKTLEVEYQDKALLKIKTLLESSTNYPFENGNPRKLHIISDFLTAIAPSLPKDESGNLARGPQESLIPLLANVADYYDPEGKCKEHPEVVLACTQALWGLEYGFYDFWKTQATNPVTQEFVVTQMLEMPHVEGQDPKAHGWYLLKDTLAQIAPALAASSSPKKIEFLDSIMEDKDPTIMKLVAGLRVPMSMDDIPKKLLDFETPGIKQFWHERIRDSRAVAPLTQEAAIGIMLEAKTEDGKLPGWSLLRENLKHIIIPMADHPSEKKVAFLVKAAKSDTPSIAEAAFRATASMKPIPGEMITIAKERKQKAEADRAAKVEAPKEIREALLSALRSALAARESAKQAAVEAISICNDTEATPQPTAKAKRKEALETLAAIRKEDQEARSRVTQVLTATAEFLDIVERRRNIAKGGKDELISMDELLGMYASDHGIRFGYMAPFIKRRHEKAMKDALEGNSDQQSRAILILQLFERHNLIVGGTKAHNQTVVDALLEKGPDGWKGVLKDQFPGLAPLIISSQSSKKVPFLASLVQSGNPIIVSRALDASLVLEQTPEEIVATAESMKDDVKLNAIVADFLDTVQLLGKVDLGNGEQFEAAEALVKKVRQGKPGFIVALHRLGFEMRDVFMEPSGSTHEEQLSQRQSAGKILVMLDGIGIKVPGTQIAPVEKQ
ncbi:MAG: hypothetical protein PHF60_00990 [Candidatus ainarchaeum sp.]|nr:hypothetical protein [Candidatus ainarchaeum sp.]